MHGKKDLTQLADRKTKCSQTEFDILVKSLKNNCDGDYSNVADLKHIT